jgi:hypothetical protein
MKKIVLIFWLIQFSAFMQTHAQVAINTTGTAPDSASILDVSSTSKGLLIPRMDSTARKAIPNVDGMIVYDSSEHAIYVNNGIFWRKSAHYIGEHFGGGVIFWVDTTGEHGFIASQNDVPDNGTCVQWTVFAVATPSPSFANLAQATGIYSGEANTTLAIALDNPTIVSLNAPFRCYKYSVIENNTEYGGWFLPSKEELVLMMNQKDLIGMPAFGGCSQYWWSSSYSPSGTIGVWCIQRNGQLAIRSAAENNHARAIRRF